MTKTIIKNAVVNAGATTAYIIGIASFLNHTQAIFGSDEPKTVLVPVMMLLLIVISAAITGFLVFGRPVMWYLDGKKEEAVSLLAYTIVSLIVIVIFVVAGLALK